ncbi:single-stranded DNA-binding protein [Streptomyces sp. LS1784]|uniref:single-stranded DNA-binding protein n=1 Tax=Streptomyces sp. LS1784 TaxID=2851533 RepID=UPI001CCBC252|nr:single-stranded DNA-binding protein [Streptomyces sp. LS1784]
MPLPTMTGVGRVVADPELRFTPNGAAVTRVRLVFQNRRLNQQTQQWEDGDTLWIDGTAWNQLAEHVAETLTQGMEVLVTGEPRTESWEKDGQKHSRVSLTIRSIGPSLAFATAKVQKAQRDSQQGGNQGNRQQSAQRPQQAHQQPQNDPWASDTGHGTEPPF